MLKHINVKSKSRTEFIDITKDVAMAVEGQGGGMAYVYVPHTTAGLTVNEGADPSVKRDMLSTLTRLVPRDAGYTHAEGNSDAHIKTTLVGSSQVVPVEDGKLLLGTWQALFFCEFDGPRHRRVIIRFIKDPD